MASLASPKIFGITPTIPILSEFSDFFKGKGIVIDKNINPFTQYELPSTKGEKGEQGPTGPQGTLSICKTIDNDTDIFISDNDYKLQQSPKMYKKVITTAPAFTDSTSLYPHTKSLGKFTYNSMTISVLLFRKSRTS